MSRRKRSTLYESGVGIEKLKILNTPSLKYHYTSEFNFLKLINFFLHRESALVICKVIYSYAVVIFP